MTDARTMRKLLRACRRGDDRAARSLYALLAPALHAYARAIVRDHALGDDAVQGAFLTMMRLPVRRVDAVDDPAAWLAHLVRREALATLRTRRRAHRRELSAHGSPAPPVRSSDEMAGGAGGPDARDLGAHVEALPRQLREVVTLRHVCGLTFDQIEAATGVNRNTASARHRRALAELRAGLSAHDDDAPPAPTIPPTRIPRSTAHA